MLIEDVILRRRFLTTSAAFSAGALAIPLAGCSPTTADDITLVIGAAEGVLDIVLPFIPGGSALVGVANSIANDLSQVTAEWGSTDTTSVKWSKMLAILEVIPGQILTLSPELQAIIAGVGAAVNVIINLIKQLQGNTTVVATNQIKTATGTKGAIAVVAPTIPAPNAHAVSALLSAIGTTQAKLPKS